MMKNRYLNHAPKFLAIIAGVSLATSAFAQTDKRTTAYNYLKYNKLAEAREAIDQAAVHESTINDPKTWSFRARIYDGIARSADVNLDPFKKTALAEAVRSARKSDSLDKKGQFKGDNQPILRSAAELYYNTGVTAFDKAEFAIAAENLHKYSDLLSYISPGAVDTAVMIYTGVGYHRSGSPAQAKAVFQKLEKYSPKEALYYDEYSDVYFETHDTAKGLQVIEMGMKYSQDKKNLLIKQLNIYINRGDIPSALKKGEEAIALDPQNFSIYLAMGDIYNYKLNDQAKAEEMYKKSIAVDPKNSKAIAALGYSYFNKGAGIYNDAANVKDYKKQNVMYEQAKAQLVKALPFLEEAHSMNTIPDYDLIRTIMEILAKTEQYDKYNEYKKLMPANSAPKK